MGAEPGDDRWGREVLAQTAGLADLVRAADPALPVPSCPEWTIAELAAHVGRAHRWAATVVARRAAGPVASADAPDRQPPEDPGGCADWLVAGAARLAEAVREAGPEMPVWTWSDQRRAGFWTRRMAHETAVHRADAALALGRPVELAPDLAADGISEWLEILPYLRDGGPGTAGLLGDGQTMHLHAVDPGIGAAGEWVLRGTAAGLRWEHGHRKADVAVRAPASDLLLLLMGRIPTDDPRVEILGDRAVLDSWLTRTSF
jgi:uncharacterized protein (TIGR03083 family)